MGGYFLAGAAATTPMFDSYFQASEFEDDTVLYPPRWSYQRRSVRSTYDKNAWISLWPTSSFMSGDPTSPMTLMGDDSGLCSLDFAGAWEAPSTGIEGTQTCKFIRGVLYDSSGNVVSGAIVSAFVTSSEVLAGPTVSSANDGAYIAPTSYGTVNHFVVAYKAGSPDIAGTSVNTLTPTNVDGT